MTKKFKANEDVAKFVEDPKNVILVLDEMYKVFRKFTGYEALFGVCDDLFFIVKEKELIVGNKNTIKKFDCDDINVKKLSKQLKKFGLTYSTLWEMDVNSCSFKDAVRKVEEWLGLPL